jgi:hypothetical protein
MKRAVLVLGALVLLSGGCGNIITTEIIGATGVTVDDEHHPVVLVQLCKGTIDHVELSGTREGLSDEEPNPSYGGWDAASPAQGSISVNLGTGTQGWTGPTFSPEPDRRYIVDASSSTADAATSQAVFSAEDLARLQPGRVLRGDGEVVSRATFGTDACSAS